jgi:hypothetical protein
MNLGAPRLGLVVNRKLKQNPKSKSAGRTRKYTTGRRTDSYIHWLPAENEILRPEKRWLLPAFFCRRPQLNRCHRCIHRSFTELIVCSRGLIVIRLIHQYG